MTGFVVFLKEVYTYIYIYVQLVGQVGRVFTNGLGDQGLIPGRVIQKI